MENKSIRNLDELNKTINKWYADIDSDHNVLLTIPMTIITEFKSKIYDEAWDDAMNTVADWAKGSRLR